MAEIRNGRKRTTGRRTFLKGAAAAAALPVIIPASARGADGAVAPSNRIILGAIGVGGQGHGDMNSLIGKRGVQGLAVCDVDEGHRQRAKKTVDDKNKTSDCKTYQDFRELLARDDIDAVVLGLPDHWHGIIAVAAARAGKDIYGEKPLARSIAEGRAICDAVQRYGRVWQTGSWQRSVRNFRHACELVRNGRIGKVTRVEVGLPDGGASANVAPGPVQAGLDWDWWLGPAPWTPYRPFRGNSIHFHWRWIMDYSGGQLTDWAGHHIDIAHWGLDFDRTGPATIEGKGEYPEDGLYNVPFAYKFTCMYANGVEMVVGNSGQIGHMGAKWHGEKDQWIHVWRGGLKASNPEWLRDEEIGPGDERLYTSNDHSQNFVDCIRSRKETITPVETAHRSISVGLLGEIAMLTGRKLKWNPKTEEIADDPGASALLRRPFRKPWIL